MENMYLTKCGHTTGVIDVGPTPKRMYSFTTFLYPISVTDSDEGATNLLFFVLFFVTFLGPFDHLLYWL